MAKVLITGAAGFAGHHLVRSFADAGHEVIALDSLTYAGALERVDLRAKFVWADFSRPVNADLPDDVDWVVHNGAESHVTRSFADPSTFVRANVLGTVQMLELAVDLGAELFLLTSTDEVLAGSGDAAGVDDRLTPANPYAASKAGAEYMARAWAACYNVPVCVTRACNLVGTGQNWEKFIPLVVSQILKGECIKVHTGKSGFGVRRWLSIQAYCDYLLGLCESGAVGAHHAGPGRQMNNLDMVKRIGDILGKSFGYMTEAGTHSRPSYDESYWLDGNLDDPLFDERLRETVEWCAQRC